MDFCGLYTLETGYCDNDSFMNFLQRIYDLSLDLYTDGFLYILNIYLIY